MLRKILIISLLLPAIALADCKDAIKKCDALVAAQDADIKRLQDQVKELEGKLQSDSPSIPFYVWLGAGMIVGGAGALWLGRK